jgi:hypothetical protein
VSVPVDEATVREFLRIASEHAIKLASMNGGRPGVLQLSRISPIDGKIVVHRFKLDDVEEMAKFVIGAAEAEHNVYIEGRTVRSDLRGSSRGKLEDTEFVFAFVVDSDGDKGKAGVVQAEPTLTVSTSPANHHYWYHVSRPLPYQRGAKIGEAMRASTGADADTGVITQCYRIPGTPNYPNKAKQARGRTAVEPTHVVKWTKREWDPLDLWSAHLSATAPSAQASQARAAPQGGGGPVDEIDIDAPDFPDDLREFIRDGVPDTQDRSAVFFKVVKALKDEKYTVEQILACLSRYPNGIARKYEERGDLERETRRAFDKKTRRPTAPSGAAAPPPPPPPPPSGAASTGGAGGASPGSALTDARTAFRKWLGQSYDLTVFDAVASAAAAERLGGDPLWLMVVSGSGDAKTEIVRSLEGASAIVTSTISSEGALLAATARSRGSTGGLLHKIGARGLLAIKDFTSILSSDRNARGTVLAALREIHDGKWERNVGYAGGRTLTWRGRIVVVAACTTAWDTAHTVIATMGDRFVIVRGNTSVGRMEAALQAMANIGKEDAMRAELAQAMGELVASADMGVRDVTRAEHAQLTILAHTVTWARTAVERDYRSEVVDKHAYEMPTRFAKQLMQLMRGAMAIGLEPEAALRLATRCARDTIDPLRWLLLLDVADHPDAEPNDVHIRTNRPLTTVKTYMMALRTLGLLDAEEREEIRGRRDVTVVYYRLSSNLDRKTVEIMKNA